MTYLKIAKQEVPTYLPNCLSSIPRYLPTYMNKVWCDAAYVKSIGTHSRLPFIEESNLIKEGHGTN